MHSFTLQLNAVVSVLTARQVVKHFLGKTVTPSPAAILNAMAGKTVSWFPNFMLPEDWGYFAALADPVRK